MQELRFPGLFTVYSHKKINDDGTKEEIEELGTRICFRSIFISLERDRELNEREYTVFISKDTASTRKGNYCFLNEKEIIAFLKRFQKTFPEIKMFSMIPSSYDNYSGYEITIVVNSTSARMHKYILTWLRYLYEPSFSYSLLDVSRLTKLPKFRFVSYENLMNIVMACTAGGNGYPGISPGHAIGNYAPSEFLTKKELHAHIVTADTLNTIYEHKRVNMEYLPAINEKDDLDFWYSDEKFREVRLPIYEKLFDQLKLVIKIVLLYNGLYRKLIIFKRKFNSFQDNKTYK